MPSLGQALGRRPGRCLPIGIIVEAMMRWWLQRLLQRLEPTGQPATAAPSVAAAVPPAFKMRCLCVTSSVCAALRNFPGLVVGFVCRTRIMGIVASEVDLPGVALSDRGSEPGNNCLCRPVGFDSLPTRSPSPILDVALVTLCCALRFANKFPIQGMLES